MMPKRDETPFAKSARHGSVAAKPVQSKGVMPYKLSLYLGRQWNGSWRSGYILGVVVIA
jgi:hypothetical protein